MAPATALPAKRARTAKAPVEIPEENIFANRWEKRERLSL